MPRIRNNVRCVALPDTGTVCGGLAVYGVVKDDAVVPTCCRYHREPGMRNKNDTQCAVQGCHKTAFYGLPDQRPTHCGEHKQSNQKNRLHPSCPDCEAAGNHVVPSFNYEGETRPIYCKVHQRPDMMDVRTKLRCTHPACGPRPKVAIFGIPGQRATRCFAHQTTGMRDLRSRKCDHPDCDNVTAKYGHPGSTATRCATHREPGMRHLHKPRCQTPLCDATACKPEYGGHCLRCFLHLHPNNDIVKRHRTKERAVVDFVRKRFPDYTWVFDRVVRVQGGTSQEHARAEAEPMPACSMRRPDVFLDLGHCSLILEIDENQHETYDCTCENKRLMQLFLDAGSRPMLVIRFNPDEYIASNEELVTSCWGVSRTRELTSVPRAKTADWERRLEALDAAIRLQLRTAALHESAAASSEATEPLREFTVIHLFYDGDEAP